MAVIINGTTGIDLPVPLAVVDGGTGVATLTSNAVILGNGTGAVQAVAPGTAGQALISQGPSSAPAWSSLSVSSLSGLGTGVSTWLGTPSSANLAAALTDETGSGSVVFGTSPSITTPTITGTKETKVTMAANDINVASGNYFSKTISGVTTLTVSNVPAAGTVTNFILDLTNGGSAAITWWSGVKWASGTAPTLTTSGRDLLSFFTHDGGTIWNGLVLAKDIK
jgi:hypothetical protein